MGKQISYDFFYMFYINTVLLNVVFINSRAEIQTGYFKSGNYTWKEARNSCKLIGLFDKIKVSENDNRQYGWVDASVEYTPWVEYKKCFRVKQEYREKNKVVKYGNQLQECLQFCKDYTYIGLQQANCVCLSANETDIMKAVSKCPQRTTEPCKKDTFLYCANVKTSSDGFIIYKSGYINEQFGIGNCLGVSSIDGRSKYFQAYQCSYTFYSFCTKDSATFYIQAFNRSWISSTEKCMKDDNYNLISYNAYKKLERTDIGYFWLANIRRPIIQKGEDVNQTYCIAVKVAKKNHEVSWIVRPCIERFQALCDDTDMTSSYEIPATKAVTSSYETSSTITVTSSYETPSIITMTSSFETTYSITLNNSPGFEKKENKTNNLLLIALILTAVLTLAVIIVIIILCKRRTSLRSGHLPLVVPSNEVTYAHVNKPKKEKTPDHAGEQTRNNPADDTYDHMEHHRVSQNQIPTESNYDTMQSGGNEELENDYDVTGGTDRPRQIVVDDSAEYSHVQVEHHEIKDSPA
ncbi:uncharacterized protein LOC143083155 [Mytilus galloprovincialis]|uniref:uncharacterized protein LOC143083155 n=1 Tax=Mytilus galloprovincialis TaxID=29158 RepID=UPI003F7C9D63